MRVEDFVRKSVVFLGVEGTNGRFTPLGTGFLGAVPYEDMHYTFLVTAQHVVDDCLGEDRDRFSVRINRHDGRAQTVHVMRNGSTHISHNDRSIDVVVYAMDLDQSVFDFTVVPLSSDILKRQRAETWVPGPGDEISVVGLYTSHYGELKNIPVIRIGHIAAMPEEKVMTHRGYVSGYLTEVHSIGGLSGSPVLLNVPDIKVENGHLKTLSHRSYQVLGVMIGYHTTESKDDEIVVPQFQGPFEGEKEQDDSGPKEERRTGFGVVIPIEAVFSLTEHPNMQAMLKKVTEKRRKETGYKPASAKPKSDINPVSSSPLSNDENPTHREDFMRLVDAAARKPEPKD